MSGDRADYISIENNCGFTALLLGNLGMTRDSIISNKVQFA